MDTLFPFNGGREPIPTTTTLQSMMVTAEVAVWTESRGERNWKNLDTLQSAHDKYLPDDIAPTDTKGWLSTDEVAKLIHTVSSIQVKGNRIWDKLKIW